MKRNVCSNVAHILQVPTFINVCVCVLQTRHAGESRPCLRGCRRLGASARRRWAAPLTWAWEPCWWWLDRTPRGSSGSCKPTSRPGSWAHWFTSSLVGLELTVMGLSCKEAPAVPGSTVPDRYTCRPLIGFDMSMSSS